MSRQYVALPDGKSLLCAVSCLALMAGLAAPVFAQDSASDSDEAVLEEITVTATKRGAARLQDVPFAVQAVTGQSLSERGAVDFQDFFHLVPGLSVFDQGPGDKRYIIRGINGVGAGTVGIYLDETIITGENAQDGGGRQPDIKLFDIERVEVLKGPQGTTFGSSSLGGTIRYIANKPTLDETEVNVSTSLRSTKSADIGFHTEGAVNIPLVEGKAALRVAGYYLDSGGYIDNILDKGVNNESTFAGRATLRMEPNDRLTVTLMAMYQDLDTDGPSFFNRVDNDGNPISVNNYFQSDVTRAGFKDKTQIYNGTFEYGFDLGTVTATASYFKRDTVFNRDSSLAIQTFLGLPALDEGRSIITQPKNRKVQTYEVRYASDFEGPVQVLVGGFYQSEDRFFRSAILKAGSDGNIEANPASFLDRNVKTNVDEVAFFGEVTVSPTDRLTVTGGVRYFDFSIDEIADAVTGFGGGPGGGFGPPLSSSENDAIFKGNLSYQATEDALLYFQVAQGFRAGGTNDQTAAQIANVTIPDGFGSDSVVNYEVGAKTTWAGGRVRANIAAYLIEWSDIQIQDQATDGQLTFPFRGNGGKAEVKGLEMELSLIPVEGLNVDVTANFSDAALSRNNPIPATGMDGDNIPYVPDVTLTFSSQYEWPIGLGADAFFGGDVSYVSSRTTELRPDSPTFVGLGSYALLNLRAGISKNGWRASLVVNNVADNNEVVDIFRIIAGVTPDGFIINKPRSFIFTVGKKF